jgi:hypothetical protein
MQRQVVHHPFDRVLGSLTFALWRDPQFEVLVPVVGSLPVDVVDVFAFDESASETLLHNDSMFGDLHTVAPNDPVSSVVNRPSLVQRGMLTLAIAVHALIKIGHSAFPHDASPFVDFSAMLASERRGCPSRSSTRSSFFVMPNSGAATRTELGDIGILPPVKSDSTLLTHIGMSDWTRLLKLGSLLGKCSTACARHRAKTLIFMIGRDGKRLLAFLADFLNGHVNSFQVVLKGSVVGAA